MTQPNDDLTAGQAAAIKGVSAQSITRAIRDGRLKGRRVGSLWLVRRRDLDDYTPAYHRPKKPPG